MFFCDNHTHSLISPDSNAPLADMARQAVSLGLDELCVTDHCDLVDGSGRPVDVFDWPAAKEQVRRVQAQVGNKLTLRLGLELGSAVYDPDLARRILAHGSPELDFVLGSLHNWLGERDNIDLYYTDYTGDPALARHCVERCLAHTWTLVTDCPDCYDSLAHIIYPLRYIQRDGLSLTLDGYEEQVRAIFTQVARTGHALEVNTCRGRSLAEWKPLLGWFRECGGEYVTLGSDAHRPQDLAKGLREAAQLLSQAGFRYVTTYEKRKPMPHTISE